jgi:hypothetical protein
LKAFVVGRWLVPLPDGFKLIENDDSIQLTNGKRLAYFSSLAVTEPLRRAAASAAHLHREIGFSREHYQELAGPSDYGWVGPRSVRDGVVDLLATREAVGALLSCTFTFQVDDDGGTEWALGMWRGVRLG